MCVFLWREADGYKMQMETGHFWVSPEMDVGEFRVRRNRRYDGNRDVIGSNQNMGVAAIEGSDPGHEFPGMVCIVSGPCCTAMALHLDQNSLTVSLKDATLRAFLDA